MRPLPQRSPFWHLAWLAVLAPLALPTGAQAESVRQDLWVTNGVVRAAAISGDALYVGGEFTRVGPLSGPGVPTDAATGAPVSGFPQVDGCIYSAIPDGSGGWYIGGAFGSVGGLPRANLAHVLSDMSLATWDPQPNTTVLALARSGSTIYFGGFFTQVAGQNRQLVAAVDATTGVLTSFDATAAKVGFNSVRAIVVQGGAIYVAGNFTSMGGQIRNSLAALDASTGQATSWNADVQGGIPDVTILGMAANATTLYFCGNFFAVGATGRSYIAAVDLASGVATSWNAQSDDEPLTLALAGGTLYVAGQFTHIGGQDRQYIAALDATSAAATGWNPGADGWISALAVSGGAIYAGGEFATLGGAPRSHAGAVDASTGLATAWNPAPDAWVGTLAAAGSTVYVGGIYRIMGGVTRNNLAAIDLTSGMATAWNPEADGAVQALASDGATIYAGGWFTNVGGQARAYLAALDAGTGAATAWNPTCDGAVYALEPGSGVVYMGGVFTQAGGESRNNLAAIDEATGSATAWNPDPDGAVHALALQTSLFVGGGFSHIGGADRRFLAALNTGTGQAEAFDPGPNGDVLALTGQGTVLYVGGRFDNMGGMFRDHIAAIEMTNGQTTAWSPDADGAVLALTINGSTVYAGGEFGHIGGEDRNTLAAIDHVSGVADAWNPSAGSTACPNGSDAVVNALAFAGTTLFAGGEFSSLSALPRGYLAAIGDVTTPAEVALVSAEAEPGLVRLTWFCPNGGSFAGTVYRRAPGDDWRSLGQVASDGTGQIVYEDRAVTPGLRYDYRLGILENGTERYVGETSVEVPMVVELALALRSNPGRSITVAFALPDASPARIELVDVAGRRVLAREVGSLGAGRHVIDLSNGRPPKPGVYLLRLTRGGRTLTVRAVIVG